MEEQVRREGAQRTEEELRQMLQAQVKPVVCFEGLRVTIARPGYVEATAPVTEKSLNLYGNAHGGWLFALCDASSGMVSRTWGRPSVTLQASVNYIRGAKPGDTVTVKASSRHCGGHTSVNQLELYDQEGRLLVTGDFTMYFMDGKK